MKSIHPRPLRLGPALAIIERFDRDESGRLVSASVGSLPDVGLSAFLRK